jgi:hypothetical protein
LTSKETLSTAQNSSFLSSVERGVKFRLSRALSSMP